jgi:hypothetical protein
MTLPALDRPRLVRWRAAIFTLFLLCGVALASWASRLPTIKTRLGIDDFQIGGCCSLWVPGRSSA